MFLSPLLLCLAAAISASPLRGGADSSPVVSDAELGSSTAGSNSSSVAVVGETEPCAIFASVGYCVFYQQVLIPFPHFNPARDMVCHDGVLNPVIPFGPFARCSFDKKLFNGAWCCRQNWGTCNSPGGPGQCIPTQNCVKPMTNYSQPGLCFTPFTDPGQVTCCAPPSTATCTEAASHALDLVTCHGNSTGCAYVEGGTNGACCGTGGGLGNGGLICAAYQAAGMNLPCVGFGNQGSATSCTPTNLGACKPGDVLFFCVPGADGEKDACPNTVGMYVGNGQMAICQSGFEHCRLTEVPVENFDYAKTFC
jgi:hypothetical protein